MTGAKNNPCSYTHGVNACVLGIGEEKQRHTPSQQLCIGNRGRKNGYTHGVHACVLGIGEDIQLHTWGQQILHLDSPPPPPPPDDVD